MLQHFQILKVFLRDAPIEPRQEAGERNGANAFFRPLPSVVCGDISPSTLDLKKDILYYCMYFWGIPYGDSYG